jgi:hypothetical protein
MAETITWTQVVQIGAGVQVSTSQVVPVDAYDVVEIELADGAADVEVQVQPGSAPGLLKFLSITSSAYDPGLTYLVNSTGGTARALDAPQVFVGNGAIELLDASPPETLFFSNAVGADVVVKIVAGRDATP